MINLTNMRLEGKVLRKKCTVYRVAVGLLLLVVPGCGVEVCESQDANLLFPNTPTNYTSDIKAKTWNKESGIRLASWMASTDFIANRLYGDRLMPIGENSIKIRNATRDDTGSYTLVQTSGSTQNFLKFTVHLEVLVPPTNQCIPNITQKGDSLYAMLPLDGCGIPRLIPNWTSGTQKRISNDISVLDLTLGTRTESYIACAEGNSKRCSEVDPSNLCKLYTVSESRRQENINTVWLILVIIVIIIIIGAGAVLLYCKIIKKKSSRRGEDNSFTENDAEMALIDSGLRDAKSYLIDQYKKLKTVAISPCNDENHVDISQVFCELEIRRLGTEDNVSKNVTTANVIFRSIGAKDNRPISVMIIGECGSGKSTWCKHIVHQWCQYHDNKQSISEKKDTNIPDFAMYEILLYIPLKKRLENSSFMEHVQHTLFANATSHYTAIMRYISEQPESVLLLIDGLDEVTCSLDPMVNLLKEEKTYPYSIVLTSRPSGLECLHEQAVTSLRLFEIHGMSLESSKDYAMKVLDILGRTRGEKLNVDHFWKFANRFQVLNMCYNPFLCLSLIFIWIESKAVSPDVTYVVLMIVEYYLRRAMNREWYKATIEKVLEQQQVDISGLMPRTKNIKYLRGYGYLIKVISGIAQTNWHLKMDADIDKTSIEMETMTLDIKVCLQTGIVLKTFRNTLERTDSCLIFSHPLLFDLFVALSIAYEKGEPFRRCITTKKAVIDNIYMIQMLCQVAPNSGQELISNISKIFETCNKEDEYETDEESEQNIICNIVCNNPKRHGGEQVQWLRTLMFMDQMSNGKLTILAEGLKFTNNLTVFILKVSENRNELIFRLPILSKLQELEVDIENCTLVIDEEPKCNKENCLVLGKVIIRSVNMDVKTTECIVEAVSHCKYLHTLELCPNNDLDAQMSAISSTKTCYGWGRLAESIKDMGKLNTVRLHNLHIRECLPALIESLCRCPTIEILDLRNINEIDTKETLKVNNVNDRDLSGCKHQEARQSENSKILKVVPNETGKILQLTNNSMSEKSWQILSAQLEYMSPLTLHIERFHQSIRVVNDVFQGIGKCKGLNTLTICNMHTGNHPVYFYYLKQLQKLTKCTLSNITMPNSSWKELSEFLARFKKLEELSLSQLELTNCFIELHKLAKVKLLELREVHLEDKLWAKVGDEVMKLSNLETLELVSCKMTERAYVLFSNKMDHSSFHVEIKKKSKLTYGEIVSIDMIVTSKRK
ncbi:hypothetical protein ACJMK2_035840 [Sinanodonta woodiana]|uniref:NACHT domain-containing protein n=1 Tax=Sinanodonta woodiana TaxID=1069815 RepID=A0ABD3WGI3_SINWO